MTPEETAAVLAKHEAMCWWVAQRHGAGLPEADVEDLAAEVRAQFVRAARTFDPGRGCKFATYALRAAEHRARQYARRLRHRGLRVTDSCGDVAPVWDLNHELPGDGGPGEFLDLVPDRPRDDRPELPPDFWRRAVAGLPPGQRQALLLRYRDGLTLQAAGARLGLSKERVRQLSAAAVEKLRKSGAFAEYAEG